MAIKKNGTEVPPEWREHDKKIKPYLWSHRVLSWTARLISILLFISFVVTSRFVIWQERCLEIVGTPWLSWLLYFFGLGLVWEAIGFPFSLAHHWVERAHGLSRQSYWAWLLDRVKGYGVGAVLGTVVISLLYLSVFGGGESWWLWIALGFIGLSVILAQLAPVLLIPLFFKLKPLEDPALRQRLLDMSARFGVKVKEVYHLGMGEKTEKGNAAFVGLGKTKRIIIGDTLYEKYPTEEVEAVFAHELGHQVHGDLVKGIGLSSLILLFLFFVSQFLCDEWVFPSFDTDPTEPYGLVLFFVGLSILNMPINVIQNLWSRWRERQADQFARMHLKTGEHLASALERLTYQNRGLFRPSSVIEFLTYSHPAPWRRITTLRSAQ